MDHAGAVIGPLVAWALINWGRMQPAQVIRWSVVPGIVAVIVAWFAMKQAGESGGKGKREKGKVDAPPAGPLLVGPDQQRSSIIFYLIVLFWLLKFPETLLLLRLQDVGLPVAATPLVWAALHVVRTSASYSGGRLTDRLGAGRTMFWGWVAYAAICLGLASVETATGAVIWFLVFGVVAALTEPPERAFVANLKSRAGTGSRFGVYHAAVGIAALAGGVLFGVVYSRFSGPAALAASAGGTVLLLLSGVAMFGWTLKDGERGKGKREA
jgi:predicted MFS family arabinose efflux permease